MNMKGFLIDLDGVLYVGKKAIDGAQEAISILSRKGFPCRFVSNTTRKCRSTIALHLQEMGFSIDPAAILTPSLAAIARMNADGRHRCMLLTTGDVYRDFEPFCDIHRDSCAVDYVIVGDAGGAMTYDNLNRAFRCVNAGAKLIALEKDRFWMDPSGLMLSAGPFVAALEYATGTSAEVMGKPSRQFFEMALSSLDLPADMVAMIGDDIITDIAGAQKAGMEGILVRTGKYSNRSAEDALVRPSAVIDSIAQLEDLL